MERRETTPAAIPPSRAGSGHRSASIDPNRHHLVPILRVIGIIVVLSLEREPASICTTKTTGPQSTPARVRHRLPEPWALTRQTLNPPAM